MQTITEILIEDHKQLTALLKEFRAEDKRKKASSLFSNFSKELKSHMDSEDYIIDSVFGKNRTKGNINLLPIMSVLEIEHEKILKLVRSIKSKIKKGSTPDASDLFVTLTRHKNVEERLFYPRLDKLLSKKQKLYIIQNIKG